MYDSGMEEDNSEKLRELQNEAFISQRKKAELAERRRRLEVEVKQHKVLIARELKKLEEEKEAIEKIEGESLENDDSDKLRNKKMQGLRRSRHR